MKDISEEEVTTGPLTLPAAISYVNRITVNDARSLRTLRGRVYQVPGARERFREAGLIRRQSYEGLNKYLQEMQDQKTQEQPQKE